MNRSPLIAVSLMMIIGLAVAQVTMEDTVVEIEDDGGTIHKFIFEDPVTAEEIEVHDDSLEIDNTQMWLRGDETVEVVVEQHDYAGSGTHGVYEVEETHSEAEFEIDTGRIETWWYTVEEEDGTTTDMADEDDQLIIDLEEAEEFEIYTEQDLETFTVEVEGSGDVVVDGDTDPDSSYDEDDLDYPYAAVDSEEAHGLVGLESIVGIETDQDDTITQRLDYRTGHALLATPDDDYQAIEDEREDVTEDVFLDQPLASFTWPSPDEFTISVRIDYEDIGIEADEEDDFEADNWNEIITRHSEEGPTVTISPE